MKKLICLLFGVVFIFSLNMASADEIRTSGLYTYKIKGNGTITITKFDWDKNKENIYIPNLIDGYNVTGIEAEAFSKESREKGGSLYSVTTYSVTIPNGIVSIGEKAFMNAPISSVNIPKNVQQIGVGAFANSFLSQFSVEPGNEIYTTIDGALYNKKEKTLVAWPTCGKLKEIPNGIIKIGDYAFYGCEKMSEIDLDSLIPESVEEIGDYAFANAGDMIMEKRFLGGNLKSVGKYAFSNCGIEFHDYFTIGNKDLVIGEGAFENVMLRDRSKHGGEIANEGIVDKQNVIVAKEIGRSAFEGLKAISVRYGFTEIVIDEDVQKIGESAFCNVREINGLYLYMPKISEATNIEKNAFQRSGVVQYETYQVSERTFRTRRSDTFTTPSKLDKIEDFAFSEGLDYKVQKIEISEGVKSVGEKAFEANKNVENVIIPKTLEKIGKGAFEGCSKLEQVVIADDGNLSEIEEEAFKKCPNLAALTIPSSVTEIGDNAFDKETITLQVEQGSYAALWASENGYSYQYSDAPDDTSWLNN